MTKESIYKIRVLLGFDRCVKRCRVLANHTDEAPITVFKRVGIVDAALAKPSAYMMPWCQMIGKDMSVRAAK